MKGGRDRGRWIINELFFFFSFRLKETEIERDRMGCTRQDDERGAGKVKHWKGGREMQVDLESIHPPLGLSGRNVSISKRGIDEYKLGL